MSGSWRTAGRMTALCLLIGGCSAPGDPPAAADGAARSDSLALPWVATGTEPGWRLEIAQDELTLEAYYGETRLTAPTPEPRRRDGALTYRTRTSDHRLAIEIRDRYCTNAMSGKPFPAAVVVTLDGDTFDGCGGDPAELLTGPPWEVRSLDGTTPAPAHGPTLRFSAGGSFTGDDGCSRYRGTYTITGIGVAIRELEVAREDCAPGRAELARRFQHILSTAERFHLEQDGRRLVLESVEGARLEATR